MGLDMSVALEDAVRTVLDHGRKNMSRVEIPAADYDALAGSYKATCRPSSKQRDPDYERELRRLYENAELDP